jgi:hypothetical protein
MIAVFRALVNLHVCSTHTHTHTHTHTLTHTHAHSRTLTHTHAYDRSTVHFWEAGHTLTRTRVRLLHCACAFLRMRSCRTGIPNIEIMAPYCLVCGDPTAPGLESPDAQPSPPSRSVVPPSKVESAKWGLSLRGVAHRCDRSAAFVVRSRLPRLGTF